MKNMFKVYCCVWLFLGITAIGLADVTGPYIGQEPPGMMPEIFAPGFISLPDRCEVAGFFTPDMNEFYFTETDGRWTYTRIMKTICQNNVWSTPDYDPYFTIYDCLARFVPDDSNSLYYFHYSFSTNTDIWVTPRTPSGWGTASKLPSPFNSSAAEWGFTKAVDGTYYISSRRSGGAEIYRIETVGGGYGPAEAVTELNTTSEENGPYVSPDHSFIMFHSTRPGGYGAGDIYISLREPNETWSVPRNVGPSINTSIEQWDPKVSPDGKYLFYVHRSGWSTDDETSDIYWVDIHAVLPDPNGPIENLTSGQRFGSIQCAITYADDGDEIVLEPGTYEENIDLTGKNITIRSYDPNDCTVIADTIIKGIPNASTISFANSEDANCILSGLTITGGGQDANAGILCSGSSTLPVISNCIITGNYGIGIHCDQSPPRIENCTIVGNKSYGIYSYNANPTVSNCIIRDNLGDSIYSNSSLSYVTYNCIEGGYAGIGNIDIDPCFAVPGYWDVNGTPSDVNDDVWMNGDCHLKSVAGRWDPNTNDWVTDDITSRCIDAGNAGYVLASELNDGNNLRINIGAFGGTCEASISPEGWALLADMNNDGISDLNDLGLFSSFWLKADEQLYADFDRDGDIDFFDFSLLAEDWLKKTTWH